MIPDQKLQKKIATLKRLEQRSFSGRTRFRFYSYLEAIYRFYERLRRNQEAKKCVLRLSKSLAATPSKNTHSIRILIDATSQADSKTKSRWTRALRFIWHERKRWKNFDEFLRLRGGPAGCAEQFAALHPKWQQRCVTYHTAGMRVPFYVDPDLVDRPSRDRRTHVPGQYLF